MARIGIFYHFLHPDPVISSILFSELAVDLARRGWHVDGHCSNRGSGTSNSQYPAQTSWQDVTIHRVWRPRWKQNSSLGRILNAVWMIVSWSLCALRRENRPDVILLGTDPILSVLIAPVWRLLRPRTKIVHWCFDLYPEAAYADGILVNGGGISRVLHFLLKRSYHACDVIVDIGPCMRVLLARYSPGSASATLVPWALSEPPAVVPTPSVMRQPIFGSARLALMYSGTMGRAHSYQDLLELMRTLRSESAHLALSVQGNREQQLREALNEEDTNVSIIPFASSSELELRLATADVHVVSLHPTWTGTVVPSKFFGALAVGRPVLFCGSRESGIARWIEQHDVGWVLEPGNAAEIAILLSAWADNSEEISSTKCRCHAVYREFFSRQTTTEQWHELLGSLLNTSPHAPAATVLET